MEKDGEIVSIRYPMLTKSNYLAWSIKMKVCMRAQRIWDAVEPKDPKVPTEESKDQMALAAIYQGIPEDMLFLVYGKETAKETWEALKIMHMGAERVKDAKVQTLKTEFEGLRMKETESIDDFASRLTTIVNQIRALGEEFEETYAVKKFLRAVPNKFLQIASAIEQFGDLKTMTMEEVIGRLKAHEERLRGSGEVDDEHLLLTRAEWKARHEAENSSQGRGRGGGRGRGRGRARDKSEEDIKLMKETGLDAYRFSISWSRLIPNGRGEVNPKGVEYYNNLINELLDHGIQPHATIFQYDLPQILEDEYNGWLSPEIIDDFIAYADVCFREFGDRVTNWTTLNEPNALVSLGYDAGLGPPGRCSKPFGLGDCSRGNSVNEPYIVVHNCLLAHSSAVSLYRRKYQAKQHGLIGMNIFINNILPVTNSTEDIAAAERAQAFYTGWLLNPLYYGDYPLVMKENTGSKLPKFSRNQSDQLINSSDFLDINYYTMLYVKDDPHNAPSDERDFMADMSAKAIFASNSTTGFYVSGYGLQQVLEHLKQSYGNPPIYIHENGYPMHQEVVFDDGPRVEFLSEHLQSLLISIRNGSNTRGYFVWSLMDLYELLSLQDTYGLYYVDFSDKDLKRYPRSSALWYADFLKGRRTERFSDH